jgi:GGDEF domain-containing protein
MSNADLLFLSGQFLEFDLPPEKKYLAHYFPSGVQRQFLVYYLAFDNYEHFTDHTGHYVSRRWLERLRARLKKLEEIRKKAKQDLDLTLLAKIESGTFRVT